MTAAPTAAFPRRRLRRRKLYEEVADEIEAMIHSGEFAPGSQLPSEREFMEQLGVGRSAVREALFALQKMGLISISSGERARVTQPTPQILMKELSGAARLLLAKPEGIRAMQHARALFEVGLAREAARDAPADRIARLGEALAANRAAIGDQAEFERTDVLFHFTLAEISGNPIFTAFNEVLSEWLAEQRTMSVLAGASQTDVYAMHAAIFDAIERRDPEGAQQAMEDHLGAVARYYWMAKARMAGGDEPGR